jgi:transposase
VEIEEHYNLLLNLETPWAVDKIDVNQDAQRVDIFIEYQDDRGLCPECQQRCPKHDDRLKRTWRHLNIMQYMVYVHSQIPRIRCPQHGAKSIAIPWADKKNRFTLLFESFAIQVLQAARSVEEARKLLKLNWHQVDAIKRRAVDRGLSRRSQDLMDYIGLDEKQFRSGHNYITNLVDLKAGRVLDVIENRTEEATEKLLHQTLTVPQMAGVKAVALDMWKAYANAVEKTFPEAKIVHDRFHISQHLNKAVDQVRRSENKTLLGDGVKTLKGTKFLWLKNRESLSDNNKDIFSVLVKEKLKTSKAWALKELFREFWNSETKESARAFHKRWHARAIRSKIGPIMDKAKMIKLHIENVLNYFDFKISNAAAEGLNSKIQTVKSNARGFRSFENFRNSILFYCGKLDMLPRVFTCP